MCGILLMASPVLSPQQVICKLVKEHMAAFQPALRARGPDHMGEQQVKLCPICDAAGNSTDCSQLDPAAASADESSPQLLLHLAASLLQLRGSNPTTSPLADSNGNILCFNGEIYGGLEIPPGGNDGKCLAAALRTCATAEDVVGVLSSLRGPWAVIYWQQTLQMLWFGRDWLGKRSLLLKRCQHEIGCSNSSRSSSSRHCCLLLSSVAPIPDQQQQQQQMTQASASLLTSSTADDRLTGGVVALQLAGDSSSSCSSSCCCLQQGSWIEVPPGIYSFRGRDLCESLSCSSKEDCTAASNHSSSDGCSIRHSSSGEHTPAAAERTAAADLPSNSGILQPSALCQLMQGLQYHAYTDRSLIKLQQYSRQQHLLAPSSVAAASAVNASSQAEAFEQQPPPPPQQQQQQEEDGVVACRARQDASAQLLQLLQIAVDVRCLTINTLAQQQHSQKQQQDGPRQQRQQGGLQQHNSTGRTPTTPSWQTAQHNLCHSTLAEGHSPAATQQCVALQQQQLQLAPASVLILFSGGVDSTLIAALAHRSLPPDLPIDLSSVCFDQGNSPDRIAARSALLELAAFAPNRQWRLIEVDSSLQEADQLSDRIRKLLHPAGTVMDLNIGTALWLAARAEGKVVVPVRVAAAAAADDDDGGAVASSAVAVGSAVHDRSCNSSDAAADNHSGSHHPWTLKTLDPSKSATNNSSIRSWYRSAARVVLLGHGADEQCGGYGRHRTKFRFNGGWQALSDELALDVKRLWIRNLGRDDRLIADHGREGRHPFLDEQLMTALLDTPLHLIADLNKPIGIGDKQVLRHALASLGITGAASREKRAIQFGTRIGKLSNKREFGSNRKANMLSAGQIRIEALGN